VAIALCGYLEDELKWMSLMKSAEQFCDLIYKLSIIIADDNFHKLSESKEKIDFFNMTPHEISIHIMSFIPLSAAGAILPLVSCSWKQLAESDILWRNLIAYQIGFDVRECEKDAERESALPIKTQLKQALSESPFSAEFFSVFANAHALRNGLSQIRAALFGAGGVGKTALAIKFINGIFVQEYDVGEDEIYRRHFVIAEHPTIVEVLDQAKYNFPEFSYTT